MEIARSFVLKLKGAILSGQDKVYIKVKATYDEKEMVTYLFCIGAEMSKTLKK